MGLDDGLYLQIRGVTYRVWPLATDGFDPLRAWRLEKLSRRDPQVYDVCERDAECRCTCGDATFRRNGLDAAGCKHIRALAATGLVVNRAIHHEGATRP